MRNPSREIDKTFLSLDLAEERGLIHRDYLAHCLRWSHVVKFLNQGHRYKDAIVLDVGCGKEVPLAKALYVNKMTPRQYVGVDANDFEVPEMLVGKKVPIKLWTETDFCMLELEDVGLKLLDKGNPQGPGYNDWAQPNILTCFEVLEHVTPEHCRRMLQHFLKLTSTDCNYFISTPCYNGSAAQNHVNEMSFGALGALLEDLGFCVQGVWGTFASISDYESELGAVTVHYKGERAFSIVDLTPIFAALRNYYDTNVLSVIFAPLFPSKARNCLWHLTRERDPDKLSQERMFTKLEQQPTPWSQHPNWVELSGYSHIHTSKCFAMDANDELTDIVSCEEDGIWLP